MSKYQRLWVQAVLLMVSSACERQPPPPPPPQPLQVVEWSGVRGEQWQEVGALQDEQKLAAAIELAERLLAQANASGTSEERVRALLRTVQLRIGLHGYETAVLFLKEQKWPEDLLGATVVRLYYADALVTYAGAYAWEIGKRERVDTKGPVDLKKWTREQIFEEVNRVYIEVFQHRQQLGRQPVAVLEEHVRGNNYPRQIRGSLRDSVSYMWSSLLADTTGWRPEQTNRVFELDLAELLAGPKDVSLEDMAEHPLTKVSFILNDLQRWHGEMGDQEAALEARLALTEILRAHFTAESARQLLVSDLKEHLQAARQKPWWAMGMALLANLTQGEDAPDRLIRARKIAKEGHDAFPESLGGQRCQNIIETIEMPAYSIDGMASDAAQKQSLGVHYKNLTALHLQAYAVDLKKHLAKADDYQLLPDARDIERLQKRQPDHVWKVELPTTADYEYHQAFMIPPMSRPGFYVVVASAREDFAPENNVMTAAHIVIGDLVLVSSWENGTVEVDAVSGQTGQPLAGTKVSLYKVDYYGRHHPVETKSTGANGRAVFRRHEGEYFLFAQKGKDIAIDTDEGYLYRARESGSQYDTILYTDRSIYRPLQTLHFKALVFRGKHQRGDFKIAPKQTVTIYLYDPNYQVVAKKKVTTNSFGTASGEFVLPSGRLLGAWQLGSSHNGAASFKVEEYKRPTFETRLLEPAVPLRLNQPATLKGEARYYFGLPVTRGKVDWRVVRSPVRPWWWDYYGWGGANTSSETIAGGITALDEKGELFFTFTPSADEKLAVQAKELHYRYDVSIDVTDEGGETRSARRDFNIGFVAISAMVSDAVGFHVAGDDVKLDILRTDLDGVPQAGEGTYRVVALQVPAQAMLPADVPVFLAPGQDKNTFATVDDMRRPRWRHNFHPWSVMRSWPDGVEKAKGVLQHDLKGQAVVTVPGLPAGVYRLHYETEDLLGERFVTQKDLVVAGARSPVPVAGLLLPEKSMVKVGERLRLLATSGLSEQPLGIQVFRDNLRFDERRLDSSKDATWIEIPITENMRGGFTVALTAVRDHQLIRFSEHIMVPWDNKELEIEVSTFRDRLRPGTKEKWQIKVLDPNPENTPKRAAEVLAYMYDRSLDAFVPHSPMSAREYFPTFVGGPDFHTSLKPASQTWVGSHGFTSPTSYSPLEGDSLITYSGYGIGGVGMHGMFAVVTGPSARPSPKTLNGGALEKKTKTTGSLPDNIREPAEKEYEVAKAEDVTRSTPASETIQVRENFAETAFWQPHLLAAEDGSVTIEFEVPDSVTSWNVWFHAVARDLASASLKREVETIKELMVRPYLPRFLREGDRAELKVVVNNAAKQELTGELVFDIIDPETQKSVLDRFGGQKGGVSRAFSVKPDGGTNLAFPIRTPVEVGLVAIKVTAKSGGLSDGELRPMPLLPGRMHLMQSRFAVLKDEVRKELRFEDLAKDDDSTRVDDQMVVTVDAQLFYSVLSALPYLVNYPYECSEQTLNRFISTGILTSMYDDYPAVGRMAKELSKRSTQLEKWNSDDPNRKMALEETPWLQQSQGGNTDESQLIRVLDPKVARANRDGALGKLRKTQTSSGAFPWFPGGRPSPYITLYVMHGFAKALEFGVDVPRDVTERAWLYLHRHYIEEILNSAMKEDCCWEMVTFLNYTLSSFPDSGWTGGVFTDKEREEMLNFSFKHWKEHSPYLKGYLALTLARMDKNRDARLVWDSVMDSAKTTEDQGTFWAAEDRSWLWYNDTIESHAFALRALTELVPDDERRDGLVLWLFLNKKLNHWKSTRATAEVVYSLAHFLKQTGQMGLREAITVEAGDVRKEFVFDPNEYTGRSNQIVIAGGDLSPQKHASVIVHKDTKGYAFASATWHFSTEKMPSEGRGEYLNVQRAYFVRDPSGREAKLRPLADGARIEVGDEIEVQLSIQCKHAMEYVHLRDPRPAGFEPVTLTSSHKFDLGIYWYEEIRDSNTSFFFEWLPVGEYPFKYRLRATTAGTFKAAPATLQPMYAPEFAAYSAGETIIIEQQR